MSDSTRTVVVDALEDAAFKGIWSYSSELTALEAAVETADIVCVALSDAGYEIVKRPNGPDGAVTRAD